VKKIFIHIGIGKTATSAIQGLCYEGISEDSRTKYFPLGLIGDVHNLLSDIHPKFEDKTFRDVICGIKDLDKSFNYFISSEFLAYASTDVINSLKGAIIDAGFELEVLLVIRNFSDLMLSTYLQALKTGFGLNKGESIIDYCNRVKGDLNYLKMLSKWEGGAITIIDYDANKKNIINVVLDHLKITIKPNVNLKKQVNLSLLCDFIPLIRRFDLMSPEAQPLERKAFINKLLDISKDYSRFADNSFHKQCIQKITDEMQDTQYPQLKLQYNFI